MISHQFPQLLLEASWIVQIANAHTATRHLIFISRAYTPPSGANFVITLCTLPGLINAHVGAQDNRACQADTKSRTNVYARCFKATDLFQQCFRRHHHTVTNEALNVLPENTGGNQMQSRFLAIDNKGMARVMAALKTNNRCNFFS